MPKLDNPRLEGAAWPALPPVDEVYLCLGTTRAQAGSDAAFRAVDLDLTLAFAGAAKAAGARRVGLVSAVGADAHSPFLYPRTKGEAEAGIAMLGFERAVLARPSFLLGARVESRPTERLLLPLFRLIEPLLLGPLRKWRAVAAEDVAAALVDATRSGAPGVTVLEYDRLRTA